MLKLWPNFSKKTFGSPTFSYTTYTSSSSATYQSQAAGGKGIFVMTANYPGNFGASGHTTFYNGSKVIGSGGYFGNPTGGTYMFWKLGN